MKKTNKIISVLLVLAMMLTMAPISAFAVVSPSTVEIGGITYYKIRNAVELDWFASQVNSGNGSINAALANDIVYNSGTMSASTTGASVWTPIGSRENPFTGIFNGQGYTISGLYSKDPDENPYLALFACTVDATVANVAVKNFYFESTYGLCAGIVSYSAGTTIYNCYAQGSIYAKDAGGAAAGICASVFGHNKTEIISCLADVSLKVDDPSDFSVIGPNVRNYIGGIICMGDKDNPVFIQNSIYITDRYSGSLYSQYALPADFTIYDSEGMPASKLATGEITYILGDGWGQKLGTDSIPEIGNENRVDYGYVSCDANAQKVYTNSATNPNYPDHYDSETDSDVACDFCGTNIHTHSYNYTASGNVITGICSNTDGNCTDTNGGTLTISAPAELYADGTTAKEATVENKLVDTSVAVDITYSTADGAAPKTAGTYTASVTVGGATASVEFTLSDYAAKVTDKDGNLVGNYKTYEDALRAAKENNDSTLTLLDDITITTFQLVDSGKFTLDLNGKTLLNETMWVLRIQSEGELIIKDSGEGGTVQTTDPESFAILNYGTVTVESGIIKGDSGISNTGTLTFNGGTVESVYSAISNSGTAYIYEGILKNENVNVIENQGTLYVYGGKMSGGNGCILSSGNTYISGGEFKADSFAALNHLEGALEVTGGSFSGTDREDGIYTGVPCGEFTVCCSECETIIFKGGEFPNGFAVYGTTANALLAEGYAFYDANGNRITVADDAKKIDGYVQVKDHYIARVTDKDGNEIEGSPFKTLEAAADAVRWDYENATITLLDDITLDSTWSVGGVVTIDLNGKTLNCTSGDTIFVQAFNGFAVTVVDSSENKTGVIRSETGSAIDVGVGSKFILNSGTITTENYYAIKAAYRERNHSLLEVNGGTVNGVVMCYADSVVTGGTFNDMFAISYSYKQNKFSGGIFNGGIKITSFDPLNNLLADGYHFRNAQGKVVDGSSEIIEEKVTIEKGADFSADAVVTVEDVVYNGSAQEPDVTVTIGGKYLTEGKDYTIAFANNINAGTATVTVKAVGQVAGGIVGGGISNVGNSVESVYTGEITKEFTILKADSSIDVDPEANKLTYNGTAQKLITAGSAVNSTMVYSLDGAEYSEEIPTGTDAGTYYVYYKVIGDANHNDSETETVTVTIGKKPVTATATAPDKQYNGIGNIDKSKITVVLDGIVDGESVETVVETAWIEGEAVGENYLVPVFFSVSGDAAKNYSFPINELYPTDFYYAEATVNIYNDFAPKKGKEYTVNSNDWINTDFVITANEGYQLSLDNELNGWSDILSKSEETENGSITFYVMNKETGAISLAVTENYKIDKTMPHGYFSDSRGRGYDYLLLDEIQTEPYYENEDIFTHKYEAWDDASGIANMEYYFSTTKLTKAELDCVSGWTEFDLDIDIEDIFEFPGDEIYSYIRVTDRAENTVYYVAHLVYDGEMARINGVLYGFTYYTTQIISVTDNLKLDYATVNGEVIKSGYNAITLTGNCDATYEIFAYDLAGNDRAEKAITMKPIATLSEPIDNIKEETVKSSDKETIEAVKAKVEGIDTTDATESEKAELQEILDKCDALIKKISDIQAEIDVIGKTVAGYTEETVKSTDKADLEQLKEDIQALIDSTNTTENEKTALEDMIKNIEVLEDKIAETEAQLEEIKGIENNFNPEKVTSDDKAAIEEKIAEIENVNPDNLTEEQKAEYDEIKAGFEALLEKINEAGSKVDAIGVELEMFDEKRVTIFLEDEIEALKAKVDELLADTNMGEAEKAKLEEYKAQCEKLIEIINSPVKYFSLRLFYFVWDALHWLVNHVVFIFNWIF